MLEEIIERKVPTALKLPSTDEDVNEVIHAIGFDFILQPQVAWKAKKESRERFAEGQD